jgi:hypothetical protein
MDTKYMNVSMHEAKRLAAEMLPHERNNIIQALDRDNAHSIEIAVAKIDNLEHQRCQARSEQLRQDNKRLRIGMRQLLDPEP